MRWVAWIGLGLGTPARSPRKGEGSSGTTGRRRTAAMALGVAMAASISSACGGAGGTPEGDLPDATTSPEVVSTGFGAMGRPCGAACEATLCFSSSDVCAGSSLALPCAGTSDGMVCTDRCSSDADCAPGMACLEQCDDGRCGQQNEYERICYRAGSRDWIVQNVCRHGPRMCLAPTLDFPCIPVGDTAKKDLVISSRGDEDLVVTGFVFEGTPGVRLRVGTAEHGSSPDPIVLDPPIRLAGGQSATWSVVVLPQEWRSVEEARLRVLSNHPGDPEGSAVQIKANTECPCLKVSPSRFEFGACQVGKTRHGSLELASCGVVPFLVTDIRLRDGTSPGFAVLAGELSTGRLPVAGNASSGITLLPGGTERLGIEYTPASVAPVDPGTLHPLKKDEGVLVVSGDAMSAPVEVPLSGWGGNLCPQPVVSLEGPGEVSPPTTIHLDGSGSIAASGSVRSYHWQVAQPPESPAALVPSPEVPKVQHEVLVAGDFRYCLDVCDEATCSSDPSCLKTACVDVRSAFHDGLRCELSWDANGAGADLDLHLAHPFANSGQDLDGDGTPDPWFDPLYDCFWFNADPDWDKAGVASDDARLDRDDTAAPGPEIAGIESPPAGRTYRVAVHAWKAGGTGVANARVRCFVSGKVAFDTTLATFGVVLKSCDLWDVLAVHFPSGAVEPVLGADQKPVIVRGYRPQGLDGCQ